MLHRHLFLFKQFRAGSGLGTRFGLRWKRFACKNECAKSTSSNRLYLSERIRGYLGVGISNESVTRIFFTTSSSISIRLILERPIASRPIATAPRASAPIARAPTAKAQIACAPTANARLPTGPRSLAALSILSVVIDSL